MSKRGAERICEKEGVGLNGILPYWCAFNDAEYLFTVSPEVFEPPPKVQRSIKAHKAKSNFHWEVMKDYSSV